jgi:exportin-2 (importin alpha re-exporter)
LYVLHTLTHFDDCCTAEARLLELQKLPGFALHILKLVASPDVGNAAVRQAAAVNFKNTIKKGWDTINEDGNDGIDIPQPDRVTIKSHLVQLMCTVPPQIQSQLSESISLIASIDYPHNWENLLPELIQQFQSSDPAVIVGVLTTANSIFKSFRYVQRSDTLYAKIKFSLSLIQEPLLALFISIGQAVRSNTVDRTRLQTLFQALRLICRIVYSLNYQDLPAFFEDHFAEWMAEYSFYLEYKNPIFDSEDEEVESSVVDNVKVSIIAVLALYASKDEECFMEYLPQFTRMVWDLLMKVTSFSKHDMLATRSIHFLSSLLIKEMHKQLFNNDSTLREIVLNIVIPNLMFRESDQERFEDDPKEYMLTEIEGSDNESRRKCSQDLLKAMCRHFESETTQICLEQTARLLAEYHQNPNSMWAAKDAAVS